MKKSMTIEEILLREGIKKYRGHLIIPDTQNISAVWVKGHPFATIEKAKAWIETYTKPFSQKKSA